MQLYECTTVLMKKLMPVIIIFSLLACATTPSKIEEILPTHQSTTESINELLSQAALLSGNQAFLLQLQALSELIENGLYERASNEANSITDSDSFEIKSRLHLLLLKAQIAKARGEKDLALSFLTDPLISTIDADTKVGREILQLRGRMYLTQNQPESAIFDFAEISGSWPEEVETPLYEDFWSSLQQIEATRLSRIAQDSSSYELRGWIELARTFEVEETSMSRQLDAIAQWRRTWVRHSAITRPPAALRNLQDAWERRPQQIALILPILEPAGNAIYEGFLSAYYQELIVSKEVPSISIYDSSGLSDVWEIYDQAVAQGADLIIGPLNKNLVSQLQEREALPINTLALNYADSPKTDKNFFQFGLAPEDEVLEIMELAWSRGHRNAAVLMPENQDYRELQEFFEKSWRQRGGNIVSQVNFYGDSNYASVVKELMAIDASEARAEKLLSILPRRNMEFTPRRRNDIDFIFLVANPNEGRQIKPTLAFYFAQNIPVYSIPSIYEGLDNSAENRDLDGIIFADAPWILESSDELNKSINENLRQASGTLRRLRAMGIDSFRLYPRLTQFLDNKSTVIQGVTGELSITDNQKIRRNLEVAQIVDGIATQIE